jgi:ELP3 family radical SAM enzyme/protein acetyltransferase
MFSQTFCAPDYTISNLRGIFHKKDYEFNPNEDDLNTVKELINSINLEKTIESQKDFQDKISRPLKFRYNKSQFVKIYRTLLKSKRITKRSDIERWMKMKAARGHSGVNVVTIFTSGSQFGVDENGFNTEEIIKRGGCPKNCHYCPFERDENGIPTQPRSYLSTEPGNMRATQNSFHPVGQMFDRIHCLDEIGHIDENAKLEIIISGGRFNFYPKSYLEWFTCCMYYAANVYFEFRDTETFPREMGTLEEEQLYNESASLRIIGLTIETRPDYLEGESIDDRYEIIRFYRRLGVTRVQIGVQHTDDEILRFVNRECTNDENKKAIKFLKDNGFKVDIHLMLDLPSSTPDKDIKMLTEVLTDPNYEADQWKIYPTEVTPYSKINEWYHAGTYKPYAEEDITKLEDVIIHAKKMMKPWIRINRIIRDIPVQSIEGGVSCPEMRNNIEAKMEKMGLKCCCIRCREIKLQKVNIDDVHLMVREYPSSGGKEFFISYEAANEKILLGFCRLRLNSNFDNTMPELKNCAFVRELHVLGQHTNLKGTTGNAQHMGFGRKMILKAEEIAIAHGFKKISIISGVGVREYYRKFEYKLENTFMMKEFQFTNTFTNNYNLLGYGLLGVVCIIACKYAFF